MRTMRELFEAMSKKIGPDKYEFQGKKGHWRTVNGSELFFPDDGSSPMGMPKAMKTASDRGQGGSAANKRIDPVMQQWRPGDPVPSGYREMFGRLAKLDPVAQKFGKDQWVFQDRDGFSVVATQKSAEKLGGSGGNASKQTGSRGSGSASRSTMSSVLKQSIRQSRGLSAKNPYGFERDTDIIDKHPHGKELDSIFKKWIGSEYSEKKSIESNLASLKKAAKSAGAVMFKDKKQSNWDWAYLSSLLAGENEHELAREAAWNAGGLSNWTDLVHHQ